MKTRLAILALCGASLITANGQQAKSLQDMAAGTASLPSATIYTAKEIITLDSGKPKAEAVAVVGSRVFPLKDAAKKVTSYRIPENLRAIVSVPVSNEHSHSHDQGGCACSTGRLFAEHIYPPTR